MKIKGFKISKKRSILFTTYFVIIMLTIILTDSYSGFTSRNEADVANIKVADMKYNLTINGAQKRVITVPGNKDTIANIVISSLNSVNSKYELIYKVCGDSSYTSYINKPASLSVEYSSRTLDKVSDVITNTGTKQLRIALVNTSSTTYYVELDINAGYVHNTLALKNLIKNEYNEEDVTIAAIIDG